MTRVQWIAGTPRSETVLAASTVFGNEQTPDRQFLSLTFSPSATRFGEIGHEARGLGMYRE